MVQAKKIFGTDGVRGVANVEPVTAETALKLGRAAAHVFMRLNPRTIPEGTRPKIVLGKDTRLSGYMLENAMVAGITSLGVDVLIIGPLPTPGVAYITRSLRADAGRGPRGRGSGFTPSNTKVIFSSPGRCRTRPQREPGSNEAT